VSARELVLLSGVSAAWEAAEADQQERQRLRTPNVVSTSTHDHQVVCQPVQVTFVNDSNGCDLPAVGMYVLTTE
jgi:hypothetical protein